LQLESIHVAMEPGDAIFFHSDTLHHSAPNRGPEPRWAFIGRHGLAWRSPYKESRRARCTPREVWSDACIKEIGGRALAETAGK
jgi:ectoine hydroxylase